MPKALTKRVKSTQITDKSDNAIVLSLSLNLNINIIKPTTRIGLNTTITSAIEKGTKVVDAERTNLKKYETEVLYHSAKLRLLIATIRNIPENNEKIMLTADIINAVVETLL